MIAICLCSRGLVYSKCMESVYIGLQVIPNSKLYMTHDLPIPDAQNDITERALKDGASKLIFIEEDHYNGEKEWMELANATADIATLQYNDKNGSPHGIIHYNEKMEILWCGMGSTMMQKRVFDALDKPYFRDDVRYRIVRKKDTDIGTIVTEYEELPIRAKWGYGGQDVDFYTRVRKKGFRIERIPDLRSIHMKVVKMGDPTVNKGVHEITAV